MAKDLPKSYSTGTIQRLRVCYRVSTSNCRGKVEKRFWFQHTAVLAATATDWVVPPLQEASQRQDDMFILFLGSGILTKNFICHWYREGGKPELQSNIWNPNRFYPIQSRDDKIPYNSRSLTTESHWQVTIIPNRKANEKLIFQSHHFWGALKLLNFHGEVCVSILSVLGKLNGWPWSCGRPYEKMIPPLAHRVPRTSRQNLDKKKKHQDVEAVVVKIALLGTRFCLIFGHVPNVRFFCWFLVEVLFVFVGFFCWSFWYLSNCLEFISSSMAGRPAKVDFDNLARIRGWSWMSRLHNTRLFGEVVILGPK